MIRKKPSYDGRQQVTRIPPYRPGDWVKLKELDGNADRAWGLSGRALRVRSITCSITEADQRRPIWRVHFENGRSVEWHMIDRLATDHGLESVLVGAPAERARCEQIAAESRSGAVVAAGTRRSLIDTIFNMNARHLGAEAVTVFEALDDAGLVTAAVNFTCYRGRTEHRTTLPGVRRRIPSHRLRDLPDSSTTHNLAKKSVCAKLERT